MKAVRELVLWGAVMAVVAATALIAGWRPASAGEAPRTSGYKVLDPISEGNLTIFPVIASTAHDAREFLTLDEGLRSGEVTVSEMGRISPLVRRRNRPIPAPGGGPQVNQLVLVNNSDRPLLLLAGEIVSGGKQDRVIGKDRIIPPQSDPVDLSVFCVEPGRWTGASENFKSSGASLMVQPSVRKEAMADKDQLKVWEQVNKSKVAMAQSVEVTAAAGAAAVAPGAAPPPPPPIARELAQISSYDKAMSNSEVKKQVDSVAAPVERRYRSAIADLKAKNAVGVVVAVNGEIIWADIFAGPALLEKYWPKLVRSYAAEALTTRVAHHKATVESAQRFLEDMTGRHENVDVEPGVYRHTEITGDGFKAFELTSLLPKTGFDLHVAKMAE